MTGDHREDLATTRSAAGAQRVFDTVELTANRWLICRGAAATIVVASEIRKLLLRREAAELAP